MPARANVYTVTTTADSGTGSLRQAMLNANTNGTLANPGVQNINFQLGSRPYSIAVLSALPKIVVPMIIDGTTQPGYTNKPIIELNGTNTASAIGLEVGAPSTIRGLVLNRWANNAIQLDTGSNIIAGNWIGTDTNGVRIQTNLLFGIYVESSYNRIGGTNLADRNVICGNDTGIYISPVGGTNTIIGNWIGVNASNSLALPNVNNGILVFGSAGNLIGGTNAGAGNVISGNHASGVYLNEAAASGNVVQGNYIGVDASGTIIVSNSNDGITLNGAVFNLIGPGNVVSGNAQTGINLASTGTSSNTVTGNFIGTDKNGTNALPNLGSGVALTGASANQIGVTNTGGGNLISGNRSSGVQMTGGAAGNWIQGNLIGVNAGGTNALANGYNGLSLSGAISNLIGGALAGARNIISGNASNGVYIQLATDTGNQVQGNYIGASATGTKAVANGLVGVLIQGATNFIGGTAAGTGNLISGNGQQGVFLAGANGNVTGNVIQGNTIGLDVTGESALPNGNAGVGISFAGRNQIGGSAPRAGNLISANGDAGIFIIGASASGNTIQGNYIGTDATGRTGMGNTFEGIYSQDAGTNQIGGPATGAGNLISANHTRGIWLTNSSGNTVQGNSIGTDVTGTNALSNTFHNIEIAVGADNNLVGGTNAGAGNRIAYAPNSYAGVRVRDGATNNLISGNSIFGNTGLGIDLGPFGVNPNIDCQSGVTNGSANAYQNYPVITNVVCSPGSTLIRGYLDSATGKSYQVQFFANPAVDPSGYGQGRTYLGNMALTLGSTCSLNFAALLPATIPAGSIVTATATDPAGNTSEFSADIAAAGPPVVQMTLSGASILTYTNHKGMKATIITYSNSVVSFTNGTGPFSLQQTFSLQPANWVTVTNLPVLSNGIFTLTSPLSRSNVFYRLAAP